MPMMPRDLPPHLGQQPSSSDSSPAQRPRSPQMPVVDDEDDGGDENIFRDMTFDEVLEDLNARFLVNLPKEEMTLVRIYWQAEQAHWFYEDYLRPLNPLLPSLSQRHFTQLIISSSPFYSSLAGDEGVDYDSVWAEYISYKSMVPCCGGILINSVGDKCLMVRGWKSNAGWSFPRGKINLNESEVDCAIREVEEETGFDLTGRVNPVDNIQTQINAQVVTMFIAKDIDETTVFEAQTRKEIGAIEWVRLTELPTWTGKRPKKTNSKDKKFYNVTPFVGPLKRWLHEHGINPNPKPKKVLSQSAQTNRDLKPFEFESPVLAPQQPQARGGSALDHLFNKFVHKQEEELVSGERAVGGDNKAGLERLFGNLHVLQPEKRETQEVQAQQQSEDDALVKLLGAVVVSQPAPAPAPPPPTSAKQSKLLAMLNQNAVEAIQPQDISPTPVAAAIKPHQESLLAMLSQQSHAPAPAASAAHPTNMLSPTTGKPMSLPTSPRPPSANDEEKRRNRQRALLEMTIAGIGLDSTAPSHSAASVLVPANPSVPVSLDSHGPKRSSADRNRRVTPPGAHAQGFPQTQAPIGRTPHSSYPPSQGSPTKSRPPPPPYDGQHRMSAGHLAPYDQHIPHPPSLPVPPPQMVEHQRVMLGPPHGRPSMGAAGGQGGPAQGYRPAQAVYQGFPTSSVSQQPLLYSSQQQGFAPPLSWAQQPPQMGYVTHPAVPQNHPHPSQQPFQPPFAGNNNTFRPPPNVPTNYSNPPGQGQYQPFPPQAYPQQLPQTNYLQQNQPQPNPLPHPLPPAQNQNHAPAQRSPPKQPPVGMHQPVPRPPNGVAGNLLAMINGTGGTGR